MPYPSSVPAYIASLPPAHRALAKRFDTLVGKVIPEVERVIKWGLPFYGIEGRGWFVSFGVVRGEVRITLFQAPKGDPTTPRGAPSLRASVVPWEFRCSAMEQRSTTPPSALTAKPASRHRPWTTQAVRLAPTS